ncbi:MAG: hypothetical protein HZA90_28305 [Verrucomicrobia bacterium]|nr:hypothetical protein [Verrucomicrobiota bacterium]
MNAEYIQRRLRGGFRPFTLHLSDGRKYAVPHAEFILVTQHSVAVADKDGYIESLDPAHIVSLRDLVVKAGAGKSGK